MTFARAKVVSAPIHAPPARTIVPTSTIQTAPARAVVLTAPIDRPPAQAIQDPSSMPCTPARARVFPAPISRTPAWAKVSARRPNEPSPARAIGRALSSCEHARAGQRVYVTHISHACAGHRSPVTQWKAARASEAAA